MALTEQRALPVIKARANSRGIIAWSLAVFAAGLSAAAPLAYYADQGLEAGIAWLATNAPAFLRPYVPRPIERVMPLPHRTPAARPLAVTPTPASPEPAATKAAPRPARPPRGKAVALPTESSALAARPAERPQEEASPRALEPEPSAAPVKTAVEPAKTRPARSGDGLDDLMGGMGSGSPPKDKHATSREIDSMLKEVQKSDPPPRPKRVEPAAAPALTASEIASVMAGVKSRANACGKRLGQHGMADLKLTIGKDGTVTDVVLRGKLADTPVGECVTKAARGATFSANPGLRFDYRIDVQQ